SLGAIAYALLSNQLPFQRASWPLLVKAIATTAPSPLRAWRPDVPPPIAEAITRAMSKDPASRPADAASFAQALLAGARSTRPMVSLSQTQATIPQAAAIEGSPAEETFENLPGKQLDGKLDVLERVETGGGGAIFRARHTLTGNEVVLHVLRPALAAR